MKKIFFLVMIVSACHFVYGQGRDEFFRASDPAKSVQVYPNPAIDFITVRFEVPSAKIVKLEFHSIIGSTLDLEQEAVDDFEIRVKVKELPVGYYIIAINDPINNTIGLWSHRL